ncbi:hypothetical protein N7481_004920 [Penicillium waksmanii]|uniref:uncharacterized protein n=1 Tax=Penicillium waksmanii TaxID=69791 RepID=UPI002547BD8E|nr:uncharacterized protein N7481_004920 [Penicillium waksmanii]KAJ5989710.1 hypothetical protein N7481_004920 [Penicillium waksmanii]
MATLIVGRSVLPELETALEIQDFYLSGALYNTLLDDSDQPRVADEHIKNLAEIFVRHNAQNVLGIYLIYGYFKIPESTVMLGTNFESPSLRWTKVTDIDKINHSRDGPLPDLSGVGPGFLDEFIDYIVKNNLASLIGL